MKGLMGVRSIPIIKFMFTDEFKNLDDALVMSLSHYGRIENCPSLTDTYKYLGNLDTAFIVAFVNERQDLIELAKLMKMRKKEMRNKKIKVVVINFCEDKYFEKVLTELGLGEFMISTKDSNEIKSRLDYWLMFFYDELRGASTSRSLKEDRHIVKGSTFDYGAELKSKFDITSLSEEEELHRVTQDMSFSSYVIQNEKLMVCQLDDFHDDVIFVLTEKVNIKFDKPIEMSFVSEYLGKKSNLKIEGVVTDIEGSDDGLQTVSIKLTKRNSAELSLFLKIREERQENITKFLTKVKGY